jgi:hypothetical protein
VVALVNNVLPCEQLKKNRLTGKMTDWVTLKKNTPPQMAGVMTVQQMTKK